jgi:hypothetical protein
MTSTKQVNLRLSVDLINAYQELADSADDRDRSYFMKKALMDYVSRKPKKRTEKDEPELDLFFNKFWESGIRKVGKKDARSAFKKIIDKKYQKIEFTEYLVKDIQWRLANEQLGFAEMHPTTYLRNERWTDEKRPKQTSSNQSYSDRAEADAAAILAQCEANEAGNGFVAANERPLPEPMGEGRRGYDGEQPIDAEFSVVGRENGAAY